MLTLPVLETDSLVLRRFELDDAERVHTLLNTPQVADTLMDITLPYTLEDARKLIMYSHEAVPTGTAYLFGIEHKPTSQLIGYIDIEVDPANQHGEIAYWLGVDFWRQGYATAAAKRVLQFAFAELKLHRVYAYCLAHNVASVRVLIKAGLQYEGTLRQEALQNGVFADVEFYGLLKDEAETASPR